MRIYTDPKGAEFFYDLIPMVSVMEEQWHCATVEESLARMSSSLSGLSEEEARSRLQNYGPNELTAKGRTSRLKILLRQFKSLLVVILIAAAGISAAIGIVNQSSEEYLDAAVIMLIVIINAMLGFFQEYRAEQALQALKEMAAPKATVIRGGTERQIPSKELVPGDVIILATGDKVPADGRVIESFNLKVNEAPLTGESEATPKQVSCLADEIVVMDKANMVFSGCAVEYGRGKALVTETGMRTALGKIAELIETADEETPLQKKLARLGKQLGIAILAATAFIFLVGLLQNVAAEQMFLTAVSLAVAAIPEGLPAIVTISLALGLQRMAKRNAVVRSLPAVESLGSATVICTDKTGTLTKGEMNIREVVVSQPVSVSGEGFEPRGNFTVKGAEIDPSTIPELEWLMRAGVLCNDSNLYEEKGRWMIRGDTTEGTFLVMGRRANLDVDKIRREWPRISEIPFDSNKKRMITFHEHDGKKYAFLKGGTEPVLDICDHRLVGADVEPLEEAEKAILQDQSNALAERALRVLAVGMRSLPPMIGEDELEEHFTFLGLVGMIDAPRTEAIVAIARCKRAGIRVVMITGDHELTARAIAAEMGIAPRGAKVINGRTLETTSTEALAEMVKDVSVFARVAPEHKVKIVEALKANGEIVAMTGDGVNDAPALKRADIGVAMGITGTDVAKEASEIVLTDDNFASIVNAVEEGRGIYDNIKKFVAFLLACNVGEVVTMFLASLFFLLPGMVPFLLPIQILWTNLATDGFPALAIGLEPTSPTVMDRPPRDPKESPVPRKAVYRIFVIASIMAIGTLISFQLAYDNSLQVLGLGNEAAIVRARTVAFCTLVSFQLLFSFSARSETETIWKLGPLSNRKLLAAVAASFGLQLLVVYLPGVGTAFGTVPIGLQEWGLIIMIALTGLIANELWKFVAASNKHKSERTLVQ